MYRNDEKKKTRKQVVKPGVYNSKVISVTVDEDYVQHVILVTYELTTEDGKTLEFTETFWLNNNNERSNELLDYLAENEIYEDHLEEFTGCHEQVTIKKNINHGHAFPSIVAREFIDHPGENS